MAEDRHVRGVLEHQQFGALLRRNGRRDAPAAARPAGATLEHVVELARRRRPHDEILGPVDYEYPQAAQGPQTVV